MGCVLLLANGGGAAGRASSAWYVQLAAARVAQHVDCLGVEQCARNEVCHIVGCVHSIGLTVIQSVALRSCVRQYAMCNTDNHNYRGITMLPTIDKLFTSLPATRIAEAGPCH